MDGKAAEIKSNRMHCQKMELKSKPGEGKCTTRRKESNLRKSPGALPGFQWLFVVETREELARRTPPSKGM
jgi:hypothetical protein